MTLGSSPTPSVKTSFHQAHIPRSFGGCDLEHLRVSCQQETGSELVALLSALCSSPCDPLPCDGAGLPTCSPELSLHEEVLRKGIHGGCFLTGL